MSIMIDEKSKTEMYEAQPSLDDEEKENRARGRRTMSAEVNEILIL